MSLERHSSLRRILDPTADCIDLEEQIGNLSRKPYTGKKWTRCVCFVSFILSAFQMVCGAVFGTVAAVLVFVPDKVEHHLQTPLPIYVSAVITSLAGLLTAVTAKVRNPYLLLLGIFSCMTSCVTSLAGLLSTAVTSLPLYSSFQYFRYISVNQTCMACTKKIDNGDGCYGMEFGKISSCVAIEFTMKNITITIVLVYSATCVTALTATAALSAILCTISRNAHKRMQQTFQLGDTAQIQRGERQLGDSSHLDFKAYHEPQHRSKRLRQSGHHPPALTKHANICSLPIPTVSWSHLPSRRPITCDCVQSYDPLLSCHHEQCQSSTDKPFSHRFKRHRTESIDGDGNLEALDSGMNDSAHSSGLGGLNAISVDDMPWHRKNVEVEKRSELQSLPFKQMHLPSARNAIASQMPVFKPPPYSMLTSQDASPAATSQNTPLYEEEETSF